MEFQKPDFVSFVDITKYFFSMVVVMGGYIINKKLKDLEAVIDDVDEHTIRLTKLEKDIEYCKREKS